jgi:hypothetical protein
MTSLRERIEKIAAETKKVGYIPEQFVEEFTIVKEALKNVKDYPPCCIKCDGKSVSCDYLGPLPLEIFLTKCKRCVEEIKYKVKELEKY